MKPAFLCLKLCARIRERVRGLQGDRRISTYMYVELRKTVEDCSEERRISPGISLQIRPPMLSHPLRGNHSFFRLFIHSGPLLSPPNHFANPTVPYRSLHSSLSSSTYSPTSSAVSFALCLAPSTILSILSAALAIPRL